MIYADLITLAVISLHGSTGTKPLPKQASVFKDNLSWHIQQISSLKAGHAIQGPHKARRWKSIAFQPPGEN